MTKESVFKALTDVDAARVESAKLEEPAMLLEGLGFKWDVAVEIFRRVGAGEIRAGNFLTRFGEAVGAADLENQVLMLPVIYRLLAKYPTLIEQHFEKPAITEFPPSE